MRQATCSLFLFFAATVLGQEPPCPRTIPVVVMLPDGGLVRKLPPEGFAARTKGSQTSPQAVATDAGPRRIVFVAENTSNILSPARVIESRVISAILANARAEDSFALLSACGPEIRIPFGSDRSVLRAAAEELGRSPKGHEQEQGILDAVLQAIKWFGERQPGDSIFLMAEGLERVGVGWEIGGRPNKASLSDVRTALARGGIRVFGFQLTNLGLDHSHSNGYGMDFWSDGMYPHAGGISPKNENLFALAVASGGIIFMENTASGYGYTLTDARAKFPERQGQQMYKAITEYYALQVDEMTSETEVSLANSVRNQLPSARVLFPRFVAGCSEGR